RHMGDHSFVYDYDVAVHAAAQLVGKVLDGGFPIGHRRVLNVNIPVIKKHEFKGYKVTRAGYRHYGNDAHMHRNPRGEEHYWLGLHPLEWSDHPHGDKSYMNDFDAIHAGFVSISPIKLDMTAHEELDALGGWIG
ncbi:MAG TPA: 5'/3'-nucleotidase SurE, partial [Campylobacterales bacterium]|nr:5'/3'-nucleotidase SurE [Campylobacterales bacterium]